VSVSEKKWEKTRRYIQEILEELEKGKIGYKLLECKVGYLVYVAQAYPSMKPYLSTLYGTLNSWRPNRSPDGFKIINKAKRRKLNEVLNELEERYLEVDDRWRFERWDQDDEDRPTSSDSTLGMSVKEAPREVRFVNGSKDCLEALVELTQSTNPPYKELEEANQYHWCMDLVMRLDRVLAAPFSKLMVMYFIGLGFGQDPSLKKAPLITGNCVTW